MRSSVFRIAELALNTSSPNAPSASGSLPAVTRRYLSSLRPTTEMGPNTSSGVVNFVKRMVNRLPCIQAMSESSSRLLLVPGGPTSNGCSRQTSAVSTRSISSSRSMSAADSSRRVWTNFSGTGQGSGRNVFMRTSRWWWGSKRNALPARRAGRDRATRWAGQKLRTRSMARRETIDRAARSRNRVTARPQGSSRQLFAATHQTPSDSR